MSDKEIWFLSFLKKLSVFIAWTIPFVIYLFFRSENATIHICLVFLFYLISIQHYYFLKKDYIYWQKQSEYDSTNGNFHKNFVSRYSPEGYIIVSILALFIFSNFASVFEFILIWFLIGTYDIYERRYITLDVKLDLLLEKRDKE